MDLANIKNLKAYLEAKKITFATELHVRPNSDTVLISVPESAVGKTSAENLTSHRKLTFLKAKIASDLKITVEFLLVRDNIQNQIESGLNALIASKFPKVIKEAFLSFNSDGVYDAWLELVEGAESDAESRAEFRSAFEKYLKNFDVKLGVLRTADEFELPTLTQILRAAKRLAPVKADALFDAVQTLGIKAPSASWIERKLDILRKRKLLIRFMDGSYSLTEAGLSTVPHSKNRSSSDIERALALGRRKW